MAKKQKTKAGNCGGKEKHIRVRVAGILMNRKNEILLVNHVKNGKSYRLFPGGGVEYGETAEQALKREFMEELSLEVTGVKNLFAAHETIYPDGERHIINLYFRVTVKKPLKLTVNTDKVLKGADWTDINKFRKILFYPDVKNVIINHWNSNFTKTLGFINIKWKK